MRALTIALCLLATPALADPAAPRFLLNTKCARLRSCSDLRHALD